MNWDEDIDLLAGRKSQPKQGRRSNSNTPGDSNSNNFFGDTNPFDTDQKDDKPLMKPRKTSVWGEEGNKSAKASRSSTNIIELERFQSDHKESPRNTEDDIPVIPDIDDLQDDPLNLPDVKPVVTVDKSTYKELDSNQLGFGPGDKINFGNLGNIDLSFLTSKLFPEKDVQVKPEVWTMESLFNDLSRSN
ncbi:intraflagellar transport protein 43 homolog [Euwallacea fornicatus]|uniref:intraflagellar transport protein 43 homolog n=1 Tax=Euwallacea fornicatus TaxID=995702 RepID=UPI00338D60D9